MKAVSGVFSLVFGLIRLAILVVQLSYALAAAFRWLRQLIADAFSRPPVPIEPPVPPPVHTEAGSPTSEGYWADRERS